MTARQGHGPRVSSGANSKQDYATPANFIEAVVRRFGPIAFDLAAHAGNTKAARYYAPREFVAKSGSKKDGTYRETRTWNDDPNAVAFDSLQQEWHKAAPGKLLWLNPEFADITPWAARCADAGSKGASIVLLVPAAVGANWYRDHVAPHADTYLLNGRLCFDGKDLFPKDCLLAHFHGAAPSIQNWDWRTDRVFAPWAKAADRRAA